MHAVDHGCVPKLVRMLTESTDDLGLLTSSGALFEISLHPCSRLAIVQSRAVRPLIKILKTRPGSRSVAAKQELHARMQEKASGESTDGLQFDGLDVLLLPTPSFNFQPSTNAWPPANQPADLTNPTSAPT